MLNGNFGRAETLESAGFYGPTQNVPNIWGHAPALHTPDTHAQRLPFGDSGPAAPGFLAPAAMPNDFVQSNTGGDSVSIEDRDFPEPPDAAAQDKREMETLTGYSDNTQILFGIAAAVAAYAIFSK